MKTKYNYKVSIRPTRFGFSAISIDASAPGEKPYSMDILFSDSFDYDDYNRKLVIDFIESLETDAEYYPYEAISMVESEIIDCKIFIDEFLSKKQSEDRDDLVRKLVEVVKCTNVKNNGLKDELENKDEVISMLTGRNEKIKKENKRLNEENKELKEENEFFKKHLSNIELKPLINF